MFNFAKTEQYESSTHITKARFNYFAVGKDNV